MDRASILANFPGIAAARIPHDLTYFYDDFLGARWGAADVTDWLQTTIGTATGLAILDGTSESKDEMGGILSMTCEATAADGDQLQLNGESFGLEVGMPLYFETRLNFQTVSDSFFFIGLHITDTTIAGGVGSTDLIGFRLDTGSAIVAVAEKDSVETTPVNIGITEANDDWIRLAFFWDGIDKVYFYKDANDTGEFVVCAIMNTTDHTIPDNEMLTPSISHSAPSTNSRVVYVDYVECVQRRFHE